MKIFGRFIFVVTICLLCSTNLLGCGFFSGPAPKPEIGPAGTPVESKPNPPLLERFWSAPAELYDMEATAGVVFEGINREDWTKAQLGLSTMQTLWEKTKAIVGEKKGVKEGEAAIQKLSVGIGEKKITESYESLNKFMSSVSDIGKSYKLSPVADIITLGNAVRNVSFYVEDKNWRKAAVKVEELEGTWEQVKPAMEQVGILGEVTKTHATVKQIKDAVNAENKGSFSDQLASINESLGRIRNFFRGR
ncbi:MAG TPA: DUF4363 family protein [Methylomusa anaerophila]|uniref:Uncharacterized protein n=2 Tax=Methylomusa anaerophila TaxID=1930071 RepID=A0A348APF4_9FIRM|nr:DUF4363 family protein [Methylomusa anaerophila]BBB92952.1 hypothetical protein MAMMFC1_03660 [Methylomusa anaerophila]HML87214.1 DUF4363 family protein [Methylomusa anaerophila]